MKHTRFLPLLLILLLLTACSAGGEEALLPEDYREDPTAAMRTWYTDEGCALWELTVLHEKQPVILEQTDAGIAPSDRTTEENYSYNSMPLSAETVARMEQAVAAFVQAEGHTSFGIYYTTWPRGTTPEAAPGGAHLQYSVAGNTVTLREDSYEGNAAQGLVSVGDAQGAILYRVTIAE